MVRGVVSRFCGTSKLNGRVVQSVFSFGPPFGGVLEGNRKENRHFQGSLTRDAPPLSDGVASVQGEEGDSDGEQGMPQPEARPVFRRFTGVSQALFCCTGLLKRYILLI